MRIPQTIVIQGRLVKVNPHTVESLSYLASLAHDCFPRLGEASSDTERREMFEAAEKILVGIRDAATEIP